MSTNGAGPTCLHFNCGRNGPSLMVLYIYFDARSLKRSAEVKYFRLRLQTYGLPVTNQILILGMKKPSLV